MAYRLITGRTAKMPGDWKKQGLTDNSAERSQCELAFIRLWRSMYPELPDPERNYRFHPTRKWEVDFAWPDQKFGVEIDGDVHRMRHKRNADAEKGRALLAAGWRVEHYTSDNLKDKPVQSVEEVAGILRTLLEG